jgi:hypothetical protein
MNTKLWIATAFILTTIGLTSCDEGGTVDISGPEINYTFEFDPTFFIETNLAEMQQDNWTVIGMDSVHGQDLQAFLSDSSSQNYSDMVEAATLKDAMFVVTGGDFSGLDSIKLSYQIAGSTQVLDLVVGAPNLTSTDTIHFNDVKVSKEQVFELLGNDAVVKLSAIYRPAEQNFLKTGAVYQFTAKSTLSVKLLAAAENLFGSAQ